MRPRSRIQTTGPNNGHQLRDYSKSSNRPGDSDLFNQLLAEALLQKVIERVERGGRTFYQPAPF